MFGQNLVKAGIEWVLSFAGEIGLIKNNLGLGVKINTIIIKYIYYILIVWNFI